MTYEGRRQVEAGSRENLAGCVMCEHHVEACCLLGRVGRPWRGQAASRHSSKGGTRSLHEDFEAFVGQNLPCGSVQTDEVAFGLCCEAHGLPREVAVATRTGSRRRRLHFRGP